MAFFLTVRMCPFNVFSSVKRCGGVTDYKLKPKSLVMLSKEEQSRRRLLAGCSVAPFVSFLTLNCRFAWAGGKVLPKEYLNLARELVKTLRESLREDPNDITKFRRSADAAKESIRQYLGGWRGDKMVVNEESYGMLEKAIRCLANFYSKSGPSAPLPEEIKAEILDYLNKAEDNL